MLDRSKHISVQALTVIQRQVHYRCYASAQTTEHTSDIVGKGNGLFTGQLLTGLNTALADQNRHRLITITELGEVARLQTVSLSRHDSAKQGASTQGASKLSSHPVSQTPLIMHFGTDTVLSRVTAP